MSWTAVPTAAIDDGAVVGDGTTIWHHAHVRAGAHIGSSCSLGQNVYVDAGVTIGDRVKIQNNVSVYRGVTIDDDVFLGPSCVFTNDVVPRATTQTWDVIATRVGRGASIGANATIVCGHAIGPWSMVAAGAVVTHDVEPHQLVVGNPARPSGWVCACGRIISRESERPPSVTCDVCARTIA